MRLADHNTQVSEICDPLIPISNIIYEVRWTIVDVSELGPE